MRWKTKKEKYESWQDWFAWYPVGVQIGKHYRYIWLETISRRGNLVYGMVSPLNYKHYWSWEYKLK